MQIEKFTFNVFQENTFIISENSSCFIIDPGCSNSQEEQDLKTYINDQNFEVKAVLNTHCHIDHILGNAFCCDYFKVPLWIDSRDLPNLRMGKVVSDMYGLTYHPSPEPDKLLDNESSVKLGKSEIEIRFVPGHAPGHIVFVNHEEKWVIAGDTLFQLSIGRTDLPGGNHQLLLDSIRKELFSLEDDYAVHCGHGISTTIGFEKKHNPFLGNNL